MISIIVPAYNELERISNIKRIHSYFSSKDEPFEIILVDDGSTDGTSAKVKSFKLTNTKVIRYKTNKGKGYAVRTGFRKASGNIILFTDVDLSTPIREFEKLRRALQKYDIAIASRALKDSSIRKKQARHKVLLGKAGNKLIQMLLLPGIKDSQCGFKLFKKKCHKLFDKQTVWGFGFDFEILYLALKNGFTIKEVPVIWKNDEHSKVKLKDYIKTLKDLMGIKIRSIKGSYDLI